MAEIREDVIDAAPARDELGVGIQTNRTADPTASKGVQLAEHYRLRRIIETVKAIDRALEQMPPEKRRLVELRYWKADSTYVTVAHELNISERTFRTWRTWCIEFVAYHLGLCTLPQVCHFEG